MATTRAGRRLIRLAGGAGYVQLLTLSGITTVLVTRAFLAMTGYPQVGGGDLHIAHVLWGGLLMLAALLAALLFAGRTTRALTALLGGAGLGLFIDEVGKFVTATNDYFYKPAAAIVYLVFAGLLALTSLIDRPPAVDSQTRLANAAQIAAGGLISGLTPRQLHTARQLLAEHDDEPARSIRNLLSAAPVRLPSFPGALVDRPVAAARWLADRALFVVIMVALFVVTRWVVGIVFDVQAVLILTGHPAAGTESGAILASAVTRSLSAALAVVGVARWRRDRRAAYRWLRAAALVGLLVTEVFNFTDSQFRAIGELPFDLLVLALLSSRLRRRMPVDETVPAPAADPAPVAGPTMTVHIGQ